MRILQLIHHRYILQFNSQELIHALEGPPDRDVVLELDGDFVVDEGFEETTSAEVLVRFLQGSGVLRA
jgi:hypothetical protein